MSETAEIKPKATEAKTTKPSLLKRLFLKTNAEPAPKWSENVLPEYPKTQWDNRPFRTIKLRELPRFLWDNMGFTGQTRIRIALGRTIGAISHPVALFRARGIQFIFFALLAYNTLMFYNRQKQKLEIAIEKRFGREWEGLTPKERKYYTTKLAFELTRIAESG